MLYIVHGSQSYSIQFRYKKIAKDILGEIDELNYVRIDYQESSFREIINEAVSIPLGYDSKVVVVTNATFLVKETKTLKEDKAYKDFISYIKNIDEYTTLILSVNEATIDTKSEIYNIIDVKGSIVTLNDASIEEWHNYIESYVKKNGGTIDRAAVIELTRRISNDLALLRNTLNKLLLYDPHITVKTVSLLVEAPLEENVFQIYNNLINNHSDVALKIYRDLIQQNVEPIRIISTLANQFRLLHEVKFLLKQRLSYKEIGAKLKINNEKRISIIAQQALGIDESKIRESLDELYNLDLQIKSGLVDRVYALELFLIKYNKDRL